MNIRDPQGDSDSVEKLLVYWPDGKEQEVTVSRIDTLLVIEQVHQ